MNNILKIISLFFVALIVNFYFTPSVFADSDALKMLQGLDPALAGDIRNPPNAACLGVTVVAGLLRPNLSVLTCEIRCLFAGNVGYVIIAVTIFVNGVLILAEKMSWQMAILTTFTILVFLNVSSIASVITTAIQIHITTPIDLGWVTELSTDISGIFADLAKWQCQCDIYNKCPQI